MIALSLLVTLVLIVLNGFFSASEMSLVNARHTRLQAAADEGDEGAKMALKVASDSDRLLATIQVFITLLGFFASAVSATTLSEPLSAWAQGALGIDQAIGRPVATVLITLLVSYVSIVVGELLPKRIALSNPERVAARLAGPVAACEKIARPLVWITAASSNGLAKLFGIPSAEERQDVSEEEIRYIVADANELLDDEKRMIHEIMKLGDARAHDIMTPRADIIFAEDTDSVRQTLDRMRGTGYSRLPVFHEDHDRIVGVVMYKDLVPALLDDREDDPVGDYATEAYFVPETKD
ncbi:MAG: HlyC/CorC family transporter, partial [Eggerthellaceae bacterium]|nr:HlyC/CorC family transporter [Eggerthellaceae bacterium]